MISATVSPQRALRNLRHLRSMIDEYIEFAVRERIPDAMTPLLHMDRDLRRLTAILEEWAPRAEQAVVEQWREKAAEREDARGNRGGR